MEHVRQGAEADVARRRVHDVLVDLVGQHQQPRVAAHDLSDRIQRLPVKDSKQQVALHFGCTGCQPAGVSAGWFPVY